MKKIFKTLGLAALISMAVTPVFAVPPQPVDTTIHEPPIVVACIGDSITAGGGAWSYSAQLSHMLGDKWRVNNYGISGTTMIIVGRNAYQKRELLPKALESKPDVVLIMLGTNDTKPYAWVKKEQFIPDYKTLIGKFKALESKPRIFIVKPPYVNDGGKTTGINEAGILEQLPMIDQIAKDEGVDIIDVHSATVGKNELFRDGVHPTREGTSVIAKVFYQALTGKVFEGEIPPPPKPKADEKPVK